jgi:hypothetical protein
MLGAVPDQTARARFDFSGSGFECNLARWPISRLQEACLLSSYTSVWQSSKVLIGQIEYILNGHRRSDNLLNEAMP